MASLRVSGITPFVPALDFELSKKFYQDLGFIETASIEKAVLFEINGCGFWLQDYYVEDWANNSMLCLYVEDLRSWHQRLDTLKWDSVYGASAKLITEPHEQEGALMMQIGDPSGVLWHIRQIV